MESEEAGHFSCGEEIVQISNLPQALKVRGLLIDPPLFLAPMAGLTHSAFRRIVAGFGGVGLLSTEMLSAKRLPTESPYVSPYLIRTEMETPLSYQLLTSNENEIARAVDVLHAVKADAIDLNMGCPAPAVGRFGAGGMLMERHEEARLIVAESRRRTALPLTAKIRLGGEADGERLKAFCVMLEGEGVDMITVHARFKHESFARNPRWQYVADIKGCVKIPVIANGGVFSVEDARRCLSVTGADGLMLGRGAVIRPWLFAEIARTLFRTNIPEPSVRLTEIYEAFVNGLTEQYRPIYCLGRLKEFTHYFARNYKFGHYLASKVQSSKTIDEAVERARNFFERNSMEGPRR